MMAHERIQFVTGKLAEPALRTVLAELAPRSGFEYGVTVLPITVAALMTPEWIARRITVPDGTSRMVLPGYCEGDLAVLRTATGIPIERGPKDLRDLPDHFGKDSGPSDYGSHAIEILAEINHASRLSHEELLAQAAALRTDGADVIDLGCTPGTTWIELPDAVRALRDAGHRVSVDTFNPREAEQSAAAGAELILSVTASQWRAAVEWGCEVVVVPDSDGSPDGFQPAIEGLTKAGVPFRLDPILEPIGIGFSSSLGRYLEVRRRWPEVAVMMGIGNVTELTDADSAAVNVLLLGFCAEQRIGSVLTTQVIHWAQSAVRECDLARRLVDYAVRHRVPPKHLEPRLVTLRGDRPCRIGSEELSRLAGAIRDHNLRLFADEGQLHVVTAGIHLSDRDPFVLFAKLTERLDKPLTPEHAFYVGYELAKAATALTLGKNYRQDEALDWGYLTAVERSHRNRTAP